MRKAFHSYYRLSKAELDALWKDGLIVPDANVLLNLYRYSERTSEELLRLFREFQDRLWLPHQVALEFQQTRLTVIGQQHALYESLSRPFAQMIALLESPRLHPVVSSKLLKRLQRAYRDLEKERTRKLTALMDLSDEDAIRDEITSIFDGRRVGEPFSEDELREIRAEGEKRYKLKIPPGFEDDKKPLETKYGDLIIWKQVLREAESRRKGVIFLTDEKKEDWWLEWKGKVIGPLPLLREEFARHTGATFHMYGTDRFMEHAGQYSKRAVDKEAIKEVKETQAEHSIVSSGVQKGDAAASEKGALRFLAEAGILESASASPALRSLAGLPSEGPSLATILGEEQRFRQAMLHAYTEGLRIPTASAKFITPEVMKGIDEQQKQFRAAIAKLSSEPARLLAEELVRGQKEWQDKMRFLLDPIFGVPRSSIPAAPRKADTDVPSDTTKEQDRKTEE